MNTDPFRPRQEPQRSIYDAFQAEASKRAGRSFEEWSRAEIEAVHAAAITAARSYNLGEPSREEVVRAERYAQGSIDYGLTWVCKVVDRMRSPLVVTP